MNIFEYCKQQGRETVDVGEYAAARGWPTYVVKGIEYEVVGGAVDSDKAKALAKTIIANVAGSNFQWTGAKAGRLLEGSMTGDCYVLVEGVKNAIEELVLGEAEIGSKRNQFLVKDSPTAMVGSTKPNIGDFGNSWKFDDHHWLIYEGETYDVLFGGGRLDTSTWHDMLRSDNQDGWITESYAGDIVLWFTNSQPVWSTDAHKAVNIAQVNFNAGKTTEKTTERPKFLDTVAEQIHDFNEWVGEAIKTLSGRATPEVNAALLKVHHALTEAGTVLSEKPGKQEEP